MGQGWVAAAGVSNGASGEKDGVGEAVGWPEGARGGLPAEDSERECMSAGEEKIIISKQG